MLAGELKTEIADPRLSIYNCFIGQYPPEWLQGCGGSSLSL